jgi:hypothetical protein
MPPNNLSTSTITLWPISLLIMFIMLSTTIHAQPITGATVRSEPSYLYHNAELASSSTILIKRHDFTLICQAPKELGGEPVDNIPLSRRCTSSPYHYRCDSKGEPDFRDGGWADEECDRRCECRHTPTNPRPLCIGIGAASGHYGSCF